MSRLLGSVRRPWMVALFAILVGIVAVVSQTSPSQAVQAPTNVTAPVITANDSYFGYAQNKKITVTPGTWTDSPTSVTYQWYRCTAAITARATDSTNCQIITGDTGTTHTNSAGDVGFYITVKETALNANGSATYYAASSTQIRQSNVFSIGNQSMCAIRIGKIYCTGNNGAQTANNQIAGFYGNGTTGKYSSTWTGPAATSDGKVIDDVVSISSSYGTNCALTYSGAIYCVGMNDSGQLGIGSSGGQSYYFTPMMMSAGVPVTGATAVVVSDKNTCFIKSGLAYCVGGANYGLVGNGTTTPNLSYPGVVKTGAAQNLTNVIQLAGGPSTTTAGAGSMCAITSDGTTQGGSLYCWGYNVSSALGDGTTIQKNYATPITINGTTSGVSHIAISSDHACAIKSTGVWCWGANVAGQVGNGTTVVQSTPVQPSVTAAGQSFTSGFTAVSTDLSTGASSCFLKVDGSVYCTGSNGAGNLNQGNQTSTSVAKAALDWTSGISEVHMGYNFTCAYNPTAVTLSCAGMNGYGQLGTSDFVSVLTSSVLSSPLTGNIGVASAVGAPSSTLISGNSNPGDTLTDASVWTGFPAPTLTYQWYTCSSSVTAQGTVPPGCSLISGANSSTYVVQAADLGTYVSAMVTSTNAAGTSATMLTQVNAVGQLPTGTAPAVTSGYTSAGPMPGVTLTTSSTTWTGANPVGTSVTKWFRCLATGTASVSATVPAGCSQIYGATASTYKLTKSEIGFYVRSAQVYTSSAGTVHSFSDATTQIRASNALSGNAETFCAMEYGKIYCWGPITGNEDAAYSGASYYRGMSSTPSAVLKSDGQPLTDVVQFSTGQGGGSCAVTVEKSLWCWGQNQGQIGLVTTTGNYQASKITTNDGNWLQVAGSGNGGNQATCAIDVAGAVWCSSNYASFGFAGDGAAASSTFKKSTTLTSGFIQITGTGGGTPTFCALKNTGSLHCWGGNTYGNVGNGGTAAQTTPIIPPGMESGVTNVDMSGGMTCAIKSGALWCWGANGGNSFGLGSQALTGTGFIYSPVAITTGAANVTSGLVSVMLAHGSGGYADRLCVINYLGAAACSGTNTDAQLNMGNSTNLTSITPSRWTSGVTDLISNSTNGSNATCAAVNGAVYCAGKNAFGQLALGYMSTTFVPANPLIVSPTLSAGVGSLDKAPIGIVVNTSQNFGLGQTVSATLSGDAYPVPSSSYQWYRCTQAGAAGTAIPADCASISGASASTYTVVAEDVGTYLRVQVTLTNAMGSATPVSAATIVGVAPSAPTPTFNISTGVAKLMTGATITAPPMTTFTGTPTPTVTSQWYRCNTANASWVTSLPAGCYPVDGGSNLTYKLTHSDDGFFMLYGNTATSASGTSGQYSPTTEKVLYANKIAMSGNGAACVIRNGQVYCWGYQAVGGVLGQPKVMNGTGGAQKDGVLWSGAVRNFPDTPVKLASGAPLSEVVSIAMGRDHACAVTYAGTLYCWGTNSNGVLGDGTTTNRYLAAPVLKAANTPLTGVTQVAAGALNTCAIANSALVCWGSTTMIGTASSYANVNVTNLASGVQQVALGDAIACVVQNASAKCFGSGANGGLGTGNSTNSTFPTANPMFTYLDGKQFFLSEGVSNISAGYTQGCAIRLGKAYCWGAALGATSYSYANFQAIPLSADGVSFESNSVSLAQGTQSAAASTVSCVIKLSGAAYCAGLINSGAGSGTSGSTLYVPTLATSLTSGVTEMAVGGFETCAIKSEQVWCAGMNGTSASNMAGYQSNLLQNYSSAPTAAVSVPHVQLANIQAPLGIQESAPMPGTATISGYAVVGNTLTSGASSFENTGAWQGVPTPAMANQWFICDAAGASTATLPSDCSEIASGNTSTTTVSAEQTGKYFRTRITATNSIGSSVLFSAALGPVGLAPTLNVAATLNAPNSPVLNSTTTISGNAATFGGTSNSIEVTNQWYRCLTSSAIATASIPSDCMASPNGTSLTYSPTRSDIGAYLRLASTGTAATGKVVSLSASSTIVSEGSVVAIAGSTSCAVKLGRVYCWGTNVDNNLGTGDTSSKVVQTADAATPVKTNSTTVLENIASIKGSHSHYCAVDTAGALYCWGKNDTGQVGNGANTATPSLYAVTPSAASDGTVFTSGVVGVSVGQYATCAWKVSGVAYCWGANTNAQLGSSSFTQGGSVYSLIPSQVSSLTNVSFVDVGSGSACAISSGAVYCWGSRNGYVTADNDNSLTYQMTPVARSTVTSNVTTISIGQANTCSVMNYGIYCWGLNNTNGMGLGNAIGAGGSVQAGAVAQSGATSFGVTDVFMQRSAYAGCALKGSSAMYCWGDNSGGAIPGMQLTATNPVPALATLTGVTYLTSSIGSPQAYCTVVNKALSCSGRTTSYILGNGLVTPNLVGTASTVPATYSPSAFQANLGADYVAPAWSTSTATVSGTGTMVGQQLTTTVPTAIGFPSPTVTANWSECTSAGTATLSLPAECIAIAGASASTYTLKTSDVNHRIRSGFSASNNLGTIYSYSSTSNLVGQITQTNLPRPFGGGSVMQVGDTLNQAKANWSITPAGSVTYGWLRCGNESAVVESSIPADCSVISGATAASYVIQNQDIGNFIRAYQIGSNVAGSMTVLTPTTNFVIGYQSKVAIAKYSTCVIKAGMVECAGAAASGQLGNNNATTNQTTPVKVLKSVTAGDYLTDVVSIVAGWNWYGYCAITSKADLYCWGQQGNVNFISTTSSLDQLYAVKVLSGKKVASVAYGYQAICAVTSGVTGSQGGALWCWGNDSAYSIGDGLTTYRSLINPYQTIASGATNVSVGTNDVCAVVNGGLKCWGAYATGNRGVADAIATKSTPFASTTLTTGVTRVALGGNQACAIKDGGVYCWGSNLYGAIGNGGTVTTMTPTAVATATNGTSLASGVIDIALARDSNSANKEPVCAIKTGGALYCWGFGGSYGRMDGSSVTTQSTPKLSSLTEGVTSVAMGDETNLTCAIQNTDLVCAGEARSYAQFMNGSTSAIVSPTVISGYDQTDVKIAASTATITLPQTVLVGTKINPELDLPSGFQSPSQTFTWYSCASSHISNTSLPADCTQATGADATSVSYTPVGSDKSTYLMVVVTTTNSAGATLSYSDTTNAVALGDQTVEISGQDTVPVKGVSTTSLTATASSGLTTFNWSTTTPSVCTVTSAGVVTAVGGGRCEITATQPGNADFAQTSATVAMTLAKSIQTISWTTPATVEVGPTALAAIASSGLSVTYSSLTPDVCSVSGSTLTALTLGTCNVTADQAGNAGFYAAPQVSATIEVTLAAQTITFTGATAALATGTYSLNGVASSGLTVSYSVADTAICTVSGSTLTLVSAGDCVVTATQAGNSNFEAASSVSATIKIVSTPTPTTQVSISGTPTFGVSYASTAGTWTGATPLTVTTQWYSCTDAGAAVAATGNLATNKPADCSAISGATSASFTPTSSQVGTRLRVAELASNVISGTTNYYSVFSAASAAVAKQTQVITFGALADVTYLGTPVTLAASSDRSKAISYSSSNTSVCTVSGSTLTIVAAGTCDVTASQLGDATTEPATAVVQTLTVNKAAQTIILPDFNAGVYGGSAKASGVTSTSGLTVTLASDDTAVCTVSGLSVTQVAPGTCSITASQAGNANYLAATSVTKSFTIAKAAQTITFAGGTKQLGAGTFTVSGTSSSGLTIGYSSNTPAVCKVSGTTVSMLSTGDCSITATQAGNANYLAASDVTRTFAVEQIVQQDAVHQLTNFATYWYNQSVSYTAGTWSGSGTVSVSHTWYICASRPTSAVVSGTTVPSDCLQVAGNAATSFTPAASHIGKYLVVAETATNTTSAGTHTFTSWISAAGVITKLAQSISFAPLADVTFGDQPFALTATSDQGETVSFSSSNSSICSITNGNLHIIAAGSCDITATQSGTSTVAAATSVTRTLTVNKKAQTLTFDSVSDVTYSSTPVSLTASTEAGLTVAFTSNDSSVCSVTGNQVSLLKSGTCSITASQAGNGNYLSASDVTKSFEIAKATQTISFTPNPFLSLADSNGTALVATSTSGLPVSFSVVDNTNCDVVSGRLIPAANGSCEVTAIQTGDDRYLGASESRTITVADFPLVTEFTRVGSQITNTRTLTFSLTFDTAVTGLSVEDFDVVPAGACILQAPVADVNQANTFTLTLSTCNDGQISVRIHEGAVSNGADGPVEAVTSQTTTVDTSFASGSVAVASFTSPTNDATLEYAVTFSEAVTGFDASDVSSLGSSAPNCVPAVTGTGASYLVTLTGCEEGTAGIRIAAQSVVDLAGNIGPAANFASALATIDRTAPTMPIVTGLPENFTNTADLNPTFTADSTFTYHCQLNGVEVNCNNGLMHLQTQTMVDGDYTLSIWAVDTAGNESTRFSKSWTVGNYARPTTPIINPLGFDRVGVNDLTIHWTQVQPGSDQLPITSLRLEYSTDAVNWTPINDLAADSTSYTLRIQSGSLYSFRLRALSGIIEANASNLSTIVDYTAVYLPTVTRTSINMALLKPAAGTEITLTGVDLKDNSVTAPGSVLGTVVTITDAANKPKVAQVVAVTATSVRFRVPAASKAGVANIKVTVGSGAYQRTSANRTLTYVAAKVNQTITFTPPASTAVDAADVTLVPTLSSGLAPTFVIQPTSVGICAISPVGVLHAIKGGLCQYKVTSAAGASVNAFTSAVYTTVVNRAAMNVDFTLPVELTSLFEENTTNLKIRPITFDLASATSVSVPGVSTTISAAPETVCFINADKVLTIVGVGACTLVTNAGNEYVYDPTPATTTFNVIKNSQTLYFLAPGQTDGLLTAPEATDSSTGFQLYARLTSGLTPSFESLNPEVCMVDPTGLVSWVIDQGLTPSTCDVTIAQEGDANFEPLAAPQTVRLNARHLTPAVPPGGVVVEPEGSMSLGRTGGKILTGGDGVKIVVTTKGITFQPLSRGVWIGPIKAVVTIPYYVKVKGVSVRKTQICTIAFGVTKKMKATDPTRFKQKNFFNAKACAASKDVFSYFKAGNRLDATILVTRDRRWPTTYVAKYGNNGKGSKIYPTKKLWRVSVG